MYSCKFCDFAKKPGDIAAYDLSTRQIIQRIELAAPTEVHVVSGLWKTWGFKKSCELVQEIRRSFPGICIKGYTAVEVAYFAHMEKISTENVLKILMQAGIDLLAGGGAEVLSDRIHQLLYRDKIGPQEWLRIHEEAHSMGLSTNATMLFGHVETDDEIVQHLDKIRSLQDKTQGFKSFIPLAYQPGETKIVPRIAHPEKCLRVIALSRIYLDNMPHIKAYWPTLGIETAALALSFGADDLDGTLTNEIIMRSANNMAPNYLNISQMHKIIQDSGQLPVERNGFYEPVNNG